MALSIMCLECIYSMIVHVVGLQVSGLYVLRSCSQVWILARQSLLFIMQMPAPLSLGLMTMDWLFLRLFNAKFSCNVRLLQVFLRGMLTEMRCCSVRVKTLVKVGLSDGVGVQLDFPLKGGGLIMNDIGKKILYQHASLELILGFICFLFKCFAGGWEQRINLW